MEPGVGHIVFRRSDKLGVLAAEFLRHIGHFLVELPSGVLVCLYLLRIELDELLSRKVEIAVQRPAYVFEAEKVGKLFEKIRYEPTADEVRAGIKKLDFGTFGTLDWWCRRMGITDHAEGEKTPWVRIYKCLEMDNKIAKYERKLRETITKKGGKRR